MKFDNSRPKAYLAETVVVKEIQSSANVSGVVPVMSSHCAGDDPPAPATTINHIILYLFCLVTHHFII